MVEETVNPSTALLNDNKPVIVRVKRKSYQSPIEAFWLEINERPVKRPLLDLEKLSINDSPSKVDELKPKKLFAQHIDTVSSSDVVDILQFVANKPPNPADALGFKAKHKDQRLSNKTDNHKQKHLLLKSKETHELLAKNARFNQIWKSRKGKDCAACDDALHDICHLYDVERVDVEETSEVHKHEAEEDHRLMYSFLTLLQEFIPSAAEDIDSDIDDHMIKQASKDDYVYDLYTVKDDNISMVEDNTLAPFPSVQVDDNDDLCDGPDDQDFETDDFNAEDNPMNYPDDEEVGATEIYEENSEVVVSGISRFETISDQALSEDDIIIDLDKDDDEGYW